jgi:hypothetical protein
MNTIKIIPIIILNKNYNITPIDFLESEIIHVLILINNLLNKKLKIFELFSIIILLFINISIFCQ